MITELLGGEIVKLHIKKPITHFKFWKFIPLEDPREYRETKSTVIKDKDLITSLESLLSEDMHETYFHDGLTTPRYGLVLYSDKTRVFGLEVINKQIKSHDNRFYYSATGELWNFLEELKKKFRLRARKIVMKGKPRFVTIKKQGDVV